ncbi:hypothetical protein PQJ75_17680 [Rhodoplanes sp. TEM]|uniref:DUF4148 domain-containing protein n=1 Tax=Rhodoplanes tepidamans TaxID=200616 RepID=A0ABT5JKB6_RHOTP|nr:MULTISPECIES: hypothetical protein [Rhodoplanes]MDC7789801.1 hypothetical protein [Rhodoplanes tepidamans]MDC7985564.1 hypothetical protein [Rhodoplanes sp. TEM]MDQ0355292.1 peptidoglycan hydrolase CwlO-like protein [Rhodoplanes tepidamans]
MKTLFGIAVGAAVALALTGGPALAQIAAPSLDIGGSTRKLTSEEIEKEKAVDEAYRGAIRKIPEKQTVVDPWGSVRQAPSSTTAAKPQAPKQQAPKRQTAKPQTAKPQAAKPAPASPLSTSSAASAPGR